MRSQRHNQSAKLVEPGHDAALFHTRNNNAGKITQAVDKLRHSLLYGTGNLIVPFLRPRLPDVLCSKTAAH